MRRRARILATLASWALTMSIASGATGEVTRIAFGSCAHEDRPQPIWQAIIAQAPDAFLMIGDNIYADTTNVQVMRQKYAQLGANKSFQEARKAMPFFATWDDHDYGANDAGREYPRKAESQEAFLDFWEVPENSPRRQQEGVYHSEILGSDGHLVQIIMLDTRFFRSPLKRSIKRYVPDWNPSSSMLGERQWAWLETELKKPADVRIIGSSIQFASDRHGFETWGNLPRERQRLLDLIASTKANGVVLVSGDRHFAEISRLPGNNTLYPIYDFTSSGLNDSHSGASEVNPYRLAPKTPYAGINFGTITVNWGGESGPTVEFRIHDGQGQTIVSEKTSLTDLGFVTPPQQNN